MKQIEENTVVQIIVFDKKILPIYKHGNKFYVKKQFRINDKAYHENIQYRGVEYTEVAHTNSPFGESWYLVPKKEGKVNEESKGS